MKSYPIKILRGCPDVMRYDPFTKYFLTCKISISNYLVHRIGVKLCKCFYLPIDCVQLHEK